MEAYMTISESICPIARESMRVVDTLPGSISARVMKPEGYPENYQRYNVWIEIDTSNRIIWQREFKGLKDATDLWQKISTEIKNGRYELVLHVDGASPEISFPGLNIPGKS